MTTNPTPRKPVHRAERYKAESGVSPSTELMQRTARPSETDMPVTYRRRRQNGEMSASFAAMSPEAAKAGTPQPVMARPPHAPQQKTRPPKARAAHRMPTWLTVVLVAMFFVTAGLFTAKALMSAYLTQRAQERAAAYQKVVDAHPIYYKDLIEQYADANNLHPAFVEAIILNESSYRTDAVSSVGARGLMQMMPDTAQWIARKLDVSGYSFDRMYDAETNIRFGTWYLGYLSRLFRGDPVLVAAAYHAGQGEVTGWLSNPAMSEDGVTIKLENMIDGPTKKYAGRVTQAYGIYEALYYQTDTGVDDDAVSGTADPA